MHIDTVLKEIAKTVLISLPESSATKVEDMLTLNEVCSIYVLYFVHSNPGSETWSVNLQSKSRNLCQWHLDILFFLGTCSALKTYKVSTAQAHGHTLDIILTMFSTSCWSSLGSCQCWLLFFLCVCSQGSIYTHGFNYCILSPLVTWTSSGLLSSLPSPNPVGLLRLSQVLPLTKILLELPNFSIPATLS